MYIDTTFDFRKDSNGKDPDAYSPTLRKYHRLLWSKEMPIGEKLNLEEVGTKLIHRFNIQTISFGSDSISNSYINNQKIAHLKGQISQNEFEEFRDKGSTIGGYTIFPSSRENGKMTINGARGFNSKIEDRFDLTLECIRRHYLNETHPLDDIFSTPVNKFFFSLFYNFQGYVEFFLLQDLVDANFEKIKYFTEIARPFENSPLLRTGEEYLIYKSSTLDFVSARNLRINEYVKFLNKTL